MSADDWRRVIDEALEQGVRDVQFIGGEPTLHPGLPTLVRHALRRGSRVEIYSNLARPLSEELWNLFALPGVRLGSSYYSPRSDEHDTITTRRSHRRTLGNIREVVRRRIPLRVGVIRVQEDQDVEGAVAQLRALGVERVETDDSRQIGRGVRDQAQDAGQLCGRCNDHKLGVLASGEVVPCVLARWVVLGNVHNRSLAAIYGGSSATRRDLIASWEVLGGGDDDCKPPKKDEPCKPPSGDSPVCKAPTCLPPHYVVSSR